MFLQQKSRYVHKKCNLRNVDHISTSLTLLQLPIFLSKCKSPVGILPQGIYTFISVPSLKVKRISSLSKTVTYSIKLYHKSSSNPVTSSFCFCSPSRNNSIFFLCACFSVMVWLTSSSRPCTLSNRFASPSYLFWYSFWSRAIRAFSLIHCCISSATTFSSS